LQGKALILKVTGIIVLLHSLDIYGIKLGAINDLFMKLESRWILRRAIRIKPCSILCWTFYLGLVELDAMIF
jgi:hypothetical protein